MLAHASPPVASQWVKDDLVGRYRMSPRKVQVIAWAAPTRVYAPPSAESVAAVREKYGLRAPFALYPAMTWEHKNHLRLLEALAQLRDREGLVVPLVCTGHRYPAFWPRIEGRVAALGLADQVRFLGMIPGEELRALYRLAGFVVVPTLFEAASAPVLEAWEDEAPVACSAVTSLPEQAGDAALLFDPFSVEAIAGAVGRMATDADLRERLRRCGSRRREAFSWERTARAYRAVYRRAAHRPLTEEDRRLLAPTTPPSPT